MTSPFHGEFSSADASALTEANSRVLLYGTGSTSAITLDTNDQVIVTAMTLVSTAAITVTVYDGADNSAGAGEVLFYGDLAAKGVVAQPFATPHYCQKGTWPKVKGSGAGQINLVLRGYISRIGS